METPLVDRLVFNLKQHNRSVEWTIDDVAAIARESNVDPASELVFLRRIDSSKPWIRENVSFGKYRKGLVKRRQLADPNRRRLFKTLRDGSRGGGHDWKSSDLEELILAHGRLVTRRTVARRIDPTKPWSRDNVHLRELPLPPSEAVEGAVHNE